MSSQSSGEKADDLESLARAAALQSQPHIHHVSLTPGTKTYQALSKSQSRPLGTGVSGGVSQLPTILPTGLQIGLSMEANKSVSTTASSQSPTIVSVGMATPSIVQISATSSSSLLSQTLPLSGNLRGVSQHQVPAFPTHLPRGK